MALIENFDVDFEDYIIFHRGIAEAGIKEDGHFHVVYQDGVDQDIGDPYGDKVADAEAAKAAAEKAQGKAVVAQEAAEQARQSAADSASAASQSETKAKTSEDNAAESKRQAQEAKDAAEAARDEAREYSENTKTSAEEIKDASNLAVAAAEICIASSEAWAVGQKKGVDVEENDPTYNNNSKYYANLAYISERDAATSASLAHSDATLATREAEAATQAAQQTSQDLADVQNVAADIVKPLEKLEGLTYDSENDSYSIDVISNEIIDSYFAEYLPLGAEIMTQPTNYLLETEGTAVFSFEAAHATAYQWQYLASQDEGWQNITSEFIGVTSTVAATGYDTNTLTLTSEGTIVGSLAYPFEYRCLIIGENGAEEHTNTVFLVKPIEIIQQPTSVVARHEQEVDFVMQAEYNIAYQWQSRESGENEWTNLKRDNVSVLPRPTASHLRFEVDTNGSCYNKIYRCVVIRRDGAEEASDEIMVFSNQTWYDLYSNNILQAELANVKGEISGQQAYIYVLQKDLESLEEGSEAWIQKRDQILEAQEEIARLEVIVAEIESRLAEQEEGGE